MAEPRHWARTRGASATTAERTAAAGRAGRPRSQAVGAGGQVFGLVLAIVAVAVMALSPGTAQAATPAEYRAAAAAALEAVNGIDGTDEAGRARALAEVAALVAAGQSVETGGGRTLTPADPRLRAALAADDLDAVRAQLGALLAALDTAAAAPPPPPDAQAQLARVLARAEFQPPEPGPLTRLLQPLIDQLQPVLRPILSIWETVQLLWERFTRWLGSLFEGRSGGAGASGWLFVGLGGLVVLALAALIFGAFAGNVVGGAQVAAARAFARPSATATRARALALAEAGDYRAAIHELYLATLLSLDERHLLRYRADLTNREHLLAGQANSAVVAALAPLVDAYDRLWYSGAPIGAAEWAPFVALADATRTLPAAAEADGRAPTRGPAAVGTR